MFWLYWKWHDSVDHDERRAHYATFDDARRQADHDLARSRTEGDPSSAPLRITDDAGEILWIPEP